MHSDLVIEEEKTGDARLGRVGHCGMVLFRLGAKVTWCRPLLPDYGTPGKIRDRDYSPVALGDRVRIQQGAN